MRPFLLALALLAVALPARGQDGTRRALLIGVDQYQRSETRDFADLNGTLNDVRLMREVLAERGFARIDTLLGADATRAGIVGAIRAWIASAEPGDDLVFYFSGHGSTIDTTFAGEDGLETIVPHDVDAGDIVDKELRQFWNAALDRVGPTGTLAVIQDNCHSGSGERGEWTSRVASPGRRVILPTGDIGPPPSERGAHVLSASQDWQPAREGRIAGAIRGGFTWSLAQALRATPPGAPAGRVFERARALLAGLIPAQRPALSGPADRPLFGEAPAPGGGFGVGVVEVEGDRVTLQGGRFMGLSAGAELRRFRAEGDTTAVRLRVIEADGPVRSVATVVEGGGVRPGDLFEITRAVSDAPPVTFWLPPGVPDLGAVAEVAAMPCPTVCSDDPSAGATAVAVGDVRLDAFGASVVYRPLPPTAALRQGVAASLGGQSGVARADRPEAADYWLAGALVDGTPRYRWVRRTAVLSGDTLTAFPEHGAAYALGTTPGAPDSLGAVAGRIARSTEWLRRASPPTEAFPVRILGLQRISGGPLLAPDSTTGVLTIPPSAIPPGPFRCDDHPTECFRFVLGLTEADRADYARRDYMTRADFRAAYVFVIDAEGESCLAFPRARCSPGSQVGGGNTIWLSDLDALVPMETTDGETVYTIPLGDDVMNRYAYRSRPHGRHTVVLLTTDDPVAQPGGFILDPIQGQGLNGVRDRSADEEALPELPRWGVDRFTFDVVVGAVPPDAR